MGVPASLSAITTAALGSLVASLTGEGDSFVGEVIIDGTAAFSTSVGDLSQILAFFSAGCWDVEADEGSRSGLLPGIENKVIKYPFVDRNQDLK